MTVIAESNRRMTIVKQFALSCALLFTGFLGVVNATFAEPNVGVVVIHGKWDSPNGWMLSFASNLNSSGFLVVSPEMLWSERRAYDVDMATWENEVTAAVKSLKDRGADKICLAGHSSGGAGAVYFATRTKIDCLIALAPAPYPAFPKYHSAVSSDLSKAKDMVAKGQGDEKASFDDLNSGGRSKSIRMKARIFIEQNDAGGPMDIDRNVGLILPNTPVLWIFGQKEEAPRRSNGDAAYAKIPDSVPKKFVEVPGDHLATPAESMGVAVAWLRETLK